MVFFLDIFLNILLLAIPLDCGVAAADTFLLQPVLSCTSCFVVPIALMFLLTVHPSLPWASSFSSSPRWHIPIFGFRRIGFTRNGESSDIA